MARRITFARACVGVTSKPVTAHTIYATILVKAANIAWTKQRLHTDRTYQTLLCYLQTECPKRETIRAKVIAVKGGGPKTTTSPYTRSRRQVHPTIKEELSQRKRPPP